VNFKAPNYTAVAAICYAIFAAFRFFTWDMLYLMAVLEKSNAMISLQELGALQPGTQFLRFHAGLTVAISVFAVVLWLKPIGTSIGRLVAVVTAVVLATAAWAFLPAVAAGALAMNYLQTAQTHPSQSQMTTKSSKLGVALLILTRVLLSAAAVGFIVLAVWFQKNFRLPPASQSDTWVALVVIGSALVGVMARLRLLTLVVLAVASFGTMFTSCASAFHWG
jgi:hypothetical protein